MRRPQRGSTVWGRCDTQLNSERNVDSDLLRRISKRPTRRGGRRPHPRRDTRRAAARLEPSRPDHRRRLWRRRTRACSQLRASRGPLAPACHEVLADGQTLAEQLKLGVTSRLERDQSTVWSTIIDVADELSSELIVCGTHGHTAMETNLLGSVANPLAHHARRPVLIVPSAPRNPE